jgi:uncharacterized protein (TIGR02145 family)
LFGALYNWYAAGTGKLAPEGWHVPTRSEWDTLLKTTLISPKIGYCVNALCAKTDWVTSWADDTCEPGYNLSSNNSSGFSALPGGWRKNQFDYAAYKNAVSWWSISEDYDEAYCVTICSDWVDATKDLTPKSWGQSVRLVRDN